MLVIDANQNNSIRPHEIAVAVARIQAFEGIKISRVRLESESSAIEFETSEGWKIYFESGENMERAAENLASLLKSLGSRRARIDYIDLRIPDKGFYKLR